MMRNLVVSIVIRGFGMHAAYSPAPAIPPRVQPLSGKSSIIVRNEEKEEKMAGNPV